MSVIVPNITGSQMRKLRESQKKSAEQVAEGLGISRNTLMNYEKSELIPIDITSDFIEVLGLSRDQFWDLCQTLEAMNREEKSTSSVGVDPKSFGNFLFDSFRSGLSDKESRLSELQRSNERLQNQLKGEEKNNFLMIREFDKLENRMTLMEKNLENIRQQVDGKIKDSHDKVYEKVEKRLEEILSEFNAEVKTMLNKEESSGLGDFFEKSGLNSVVSSRPVAEAIAKAVLKFASSDESSPENKANFNENMSNNFGMPNVFNANFPYPQGNNDMTQNKMNNDDNMLNNNQE